MRMLRLTDAFVWEDLPLTDPDTGSLTMAAWIPRIQRMFFSITGVASIFHAIQSITRMLVNNDRPLIFETWYPFDTSKSPVYELINITQVRKSVDNYILFYCVLEVEVTLRLTVGQTVSQSVSMSWCRAPLWDPLPDFTFPSICRKIALLFDLGRPL
jgi:hypothetical protein